MENNKLISEFMGVERTYNPSTEKVLSYAVNNDVQCLPHELQYHTSWDWLMPVVEKIEQVHEGVPEQLLHLSIFSTRFVVYQAVVEFINQYNTEQLHEWARINLLPQENAETRLRFAEGIENYDEDYIKEHRGKQCFRKNK